MDNIIMENRPAIICKTCVILTVLFILLCAIINGFVQLSMAGNAPTIMFVVLGFILCVFIFMIVSIIIGLVAVIKGRPIPTSIFGRGHQSHQLAPINLQTGPGTNYGPQVMTTYRPTSSIGGQLAPTVLYSGPLPNNQLSGSNPNLGPYFGGNTTTLGPPSGPYNQFSRSDSNLARAPQFGPNVPQFGPNVPQLPGPASGPYNNQFSGPPSGPYNNQFSGPSSGPYNQFSGPPSGPYNNQFPGPMGPSPGPYNPNYMGPTHDNATSPSAPPPPPRDFDMNPPSYDDAIKKM